MVRIRYSELPVGLHVTAVAVGRQTIVYLLPGLTSAERKSALLRVRSSARVGHGPSLPVFALAKAVVADRLRGILRTLAAAMRRHPVLLVPFTALVLSVTVLVVVAGTTGATLGRLSAPEPRPAVTSPPASWRRFARHPEPLVWRAYRLRDGHDRRQHASPRRGAAAHRTGGDRSRRRHGLAPVRRPVVSARPARAGSHHSSGSWHGQQHRTRQHRTHHRWHRPTPGHVGVPATRATRSPSGRPADVAR